MTQMTKVNSKYGAPMGRHSYGLPQNCEPGTVRLFHVRLDSGGYDDGGAYWGHGGRLYCALTDNGEFFQTVRATNRAQAALLLDIEPAQLARGLSQVAWMRYSAQLAHAGHAAPVWMVSEFGHIVGSVANWLDLCHFAQTGEGMVKFNNEVTA